MCNRQVPYTQTLAVARRLPRSPPAVSFLWWGSFALEVCAPYWHSSPLLLQGSEMHGEFVGNGTGVTCARWP